MHPLSILLISKKPILANKGRHLIFLYFPANGRKKLPEVMDQEMDTAPVDRSWKKKENTLYSRLTLKRDV